LQRAGAGFGSLALWHLIDSSADASVTTPRTAGLRSTRPAHHRPAARAVIWCFLDGGPSHIDLFDPKPVLDQLAGQPLPASFKRPVTAMGRTAYTPLLGSQRTFRRHGASGVWVSDWYPQIAERVDDIAVIRGCQADGLNHVGSVCQMNTGSVLAGRPSLGSWSTYGLGSESDELPSFVVLQDYPEEPPGGSRNWGTGFVPSTYQGTRFRQDGPPILNLAPPAMVTPAAERSRRRLIGELNRRHFAERSDDDRLEARILSYELAYRLQSAAPEAVDLSCESSETLALYGIDRETTRAAGRNCLLARRLVERGVRFVQLYMGSGSRWDAHKDMEGNHGRYCMESDRPIAGLLADLKRRGMLSNTLVVWGGEFGRTPMSESGTGRDHNPYGFTMWMAGGGIRGGVVHGETDEIGLYAIAGKTHVHDIHATILHCLGLDHRRLTFPHNGRDERPTINGGRVIHEILV
jgi:hypothetical protein